MFFVFAVRHLGCYKDTLADRTIPSLEGKDTVLDGTPYTRENPVQKCYQAALKMGYPGFAVQYGGECHSSLDMLATYNKYGPSTDCAADGEGGAWSNEVYLILKQD